ncbi:hypothetical protein MJT46_000866 [Ovis ammon polii x Ovis aries]|nr:hypothetical protein MJT46_000866 [Ovis ammon polii x Ovis aries]
MTELKDLFRVYFIGFIQVVQDHVSEFQLELLQGPTSLHLKRISTFVNSTWTQNLGSGWLDDLQVHGWESDSGTAIFLKPWSKGNFSDEEMTEMEDIFRAHFILFTQYVQDLVNELQLKYPFVIQIILGCELHSGKAIESSLRGALGGLDVLRVQNHSCVPAPDSGSRGQKFCALVTQNEGTSDILERLLSDTCPRYLLGVLDAGKAELQRQVFNVMENLKEHFGKPMFQWPTSYHIIPIWTFANSSWAQNQGSGWLDDLQIQGWDSDLGATIFLKSWSKGNFSDEEMTELQDPFRVYFIGSTRVVQDHVSEFQLEYPFVIQVIAGCELHSGEAIGSSLRGALGGLDFVRIQNDSCVPAPDSGSRGQKFCALMTQYQGTSNIIERLLSETCPRYLLGVLDAGKAELQKQVFQGPTSFHLKQISTFVNSTWAQNQGSGWLDDLKIHGWESDPGTAIFLKPWSKGNFSDEEMTELEDIFRAYFIFFTQEVQDRVNEFQLEYPFVIQVTAGCELHSGEAIESSLRGALGGLDVWRIQNHSCAPAPDSGSRGQNFCALMTQYQGISDILERLLSETCPRYLLGVLDAGKAELQRQGHIGISCEH